MLIFVDQRDKLNDGGAPNATHVVVGVYSDAAENQLATCLNFMRFDSSMKCPSLD